MFLSAVTRAVLASSRLLGAFCDTNEDHACPRGRVLFRFVVKQRSFRLGQPHEKRVLVATLDELRRRFADNDGLAFSEVLTESSIQAVLADHGIEFRDRVLTPAVTTWAFLSQVLSEDHSCRDAVARIVAHRAMNGEEVCSPSTAAYCKARARLSEDVLSTLARSSALDLEN